MQSDSWEFLKVKYYYFKLTNSQGPHILEVSCDILSKHNKHWKYCERRVTPATSDSLNTSQLVPVKVDPLWKKGIITTNDNNSFGLGGQSRQSITMFLLI